MKLGVRKNYLGGQILYVLTYNLCISFVPSKKTASNANSTGKFDRPGQNLVAVCWQRLQKFGIDTKKL